MLQSGTLVMDARRFTLAVPVKNPAEHRTIAAPGYICVAYIEITRKLATAPGKQLLAVAITSGTMRNLFVGKRGVFFDADGVEYDAQIVQFLDQPVSIPDALIDPFRKFAAFVGKQFDKLFASRAGEAQNSLGADLSSGKAPAANGSALTSAAR